MSVHSTDSEYVLEVRETVLHGTMLRVWGERPGGPVGTTDIVADIRLTTEQARDVLRTLHGIVAAIDHREAQRPRDDRATATRKRV